MTVAWSRVRVRISTSSGSSTSEWARNSMSSFIRACGSGGLRELLGQRLHGRRELCALAQPVVDALAVDLDVGRVLLGVVVADLLHRRRARRLQRVGDNDAVERGMGGAAAAQANFQHSRSSGFRKSGRQFTGTGGGTARGGNDIPVSASAHGGSNFEFRIQKFRNESPSPRASHEPTSPRFFILNSKFEIQTSVAHEALLSRSMADVTFTSVAKRYGDVSVIADLNLHIDDGELMVLVGPSGCGKSTALRMIAGLEEISGGTIAIGVRVVNDVAPKDRDIAMVFQSYALYPHMSVRENLAFGLAMRHVPAAAIEAKVNRAAEMLGLGHLLARRPKALSGGQRQRVAVGRALVREPQCFLFDEPLSNLDAKLRVEMRAELKRLHQEVGTTTVYVTHDQEEAMTLGDRIVV